jgi:hypothetical protein
VKQVLFCLLIFSTPAFAHGDHDEGGLHEVFETLAKVGISSEAATTGAYVQLPDGSRYFLNSVFWATMQNLVKEVQLIPSEPKERIAFFSAGGVQRFADKLNELNDKFNNGEFAWQFDERISLVQREKQLAMFCTKTKCDFSEFGQRLGKFLMGLLVTAEVAEHSILWWFPIPLCTIVQGGCVIGGKQAKFMINTVWNQRNSGASIADRLKWSGENAAFSWIFWKTMRTVFNGPENPQTKSLIRKFVVNKKDPFQNALSKSPFWFARIAQEVEFVAPNSQTLGLTSKSLDPSSTPVERYMAASEHFSYLSLQLTLAKDAVSGILQKDLEFYKDLRKLLTVYATTIDSFETAIKTAALATNSGATINPVALESFAQDLEDFYKDFAAYDEEYLHEDEHDHDHDHTASTKFQATAVAPTYEQLTAQISKLRERVRAFRLAPPHACDALLAALPAE